MGKECKISGCEKPVRGRGYCAGHYSTAHSAGEFAVDPCVTEGCDRLATSSRGMCNACYQRWWRNRPESPRCALEGCERVSFGRGYCKAHYDRVLKTGDPGSVELSSDKWGQGSVVGGYRRFKRNGKVILEHREVMEQALGRPLRSDETVHHINGDRLDNRPENLQVRTGRHGKGVVHACGDCGSKNVVAVPID